MHATLVRQRGLSVVELMVGLALGLVIVAAALTLIGNNLRENRALLLESRLMQDLRAAIDVVSRDLRRAGYWGDATAGMRRAASGPAIDNPYRALSPSAEASDAITFSFSRDAVENHGLDVNEQFGFRLHGGVLEMLLGSGNWQALTDSGTLVVTAFSVTPFVQETPLPGLCTGECPAGSATCPPRQQARSVAVLLSARSNSDPAVMRSLHSTVRIRNDTVVGACPA